MRKKLQVVAMLMLACIFMLARPLVAQAQNPGTLDLKAVDGTSAFKTTVDAGDDIAGRATARDANGAELKDVTIVVTSPNGDNATGRGHVNFSFPTTTAGAVRIDIMWSYSMLSGNQNTNTTVNVVAAQETQMTFTREDAKIYIGSTYRPKTKLTCTVKTNGVAATGVVTFATNGGAFEGAGATKQENLNPQGVAFVYLTPGSSDGFIDTPSATFGGVTKMVNVEFVAPEHFAYDINPQKKAPEQAVAKATLIGSDNLTFPGGKIIFSWQVPLGQAVVSMGPYSTGSGTEVSSNGPTPTGKGPGTVQVKTESGSVSGDQFPLTFHDSSTPTGILFNAEVSSAAQKLELDYKRYGFSVERRVTEPNYVIRVFRK